MFEFDPDKSKSNKQKHGIDFEEATQLWHDLNRIEIPAKSIDELRFVLIAKLDNKIWSVVYTIRKEKIRIISVRRSRQNEKKIYHGI